MHVDSQKTIGSLPSYHERIEDDPVQVRRLAVGRGRSPEVSPRTLVPVRRDSFDLEDLEEDEGRV